MAEPEYVTDVPYVRSFVADLGPARLRLVAALNGFPAPPADGFDYCELGSAHGDTTATLAAAYPGARFVGVDLNPEHIASARSLAAAGDLGNVRFLERDFADLADEGLPRFDYIGAHGVVSWVSPKKRQAMLDFASARLKPGGLLYVSYNALPGWAAVEPLRWLMKGRVAGLPGSSLDHAHLGLELAKRLSEGGASYFASNPAAKAMLGTMEKMGLAYIVHEYFHAHWVPMYFAELAAELATKDLYFVGQLPLFLNYRDIAIPASLAPLFQKVDDRIHYETLKDFALNEFFRADVYVKGQVGRSEAATQAYLDETPFGTLIGEGPITTEVRLPHHTLRFVGPVFAALLPALAEGATTVRELLRRPELAAFGAKRLREAVMRLALAGQVSPMAELTRAIAPPSDGRFRVGSAYNRAVLDVRLSTKTALALASRPAGTGISTPMLQAIAIRLFTEVAPSDRQAWIQRLFEQQALELKVQDRPITDPAERARILLAEVEKLRARVLPKLLELGILEPVAQQ